MESDNRRGILSGFMAYFLWGIFPIYFKLLHSVPAVQILGNRRFAYDFKTTDWMGKYFFAGGTMPSRDLFENFLPADLRQSRVWDVNGREYSRTLDAWLERLDANKTQCLQILEGGPTSAPVALERWRMFLLFCSEVFGYRDGNEWMVFHYLFEKQPA